MQRVASIRECISTFYGKARDDKRRIFLAQLRTLVFKWLLRSRPNWEIWTWPPPTPTTLHTFDIILICIGTEHLLPLSTRAVPERAGVLRVEQNNHNVT